jgi:SPP1 gp7 family putative phage head morphogenesis protein
MSKKLIPKKELLELVIPKESYWENRSITTLISSEKIGLISEKNIIVAYDLALNNIQKDLQAFYGRYAKDNKISYGDALQKLTSGEQISFNKALDRYLKEVKKLGLDKEYETYLNYLSGKAYVTRLQELETNIRREVEILKQDKETIMKSTLSEVYTEAYYRTSYNIADSIGVGINFTALNRTVVDKAVNENWLASNYSDRIWANKSKLILTLKQLIPQAFISGCHSSKLIPQVTKILGVSKSAASRLLRTEINHISNKATMQSYEDSKVVEQYRYLATLDMRTSEICRQMDGKVFDIKDAQVGINQPPLHPHCRSTTIPYFADNVLPTRVARDISGKGYYLPKDMNYTEWKSTFAK